MSGVPPSVIVGDPSNDNPYQHQGAYAIRRQPLAINISDDVKKSYVRQQLPVRKQSLAAAATAAKAINAFYTHSKTSRHPSNASDESNNDPATPPPLSSPPSFFSRREKQVSFQDEPLHTFSEEVELERITLEDKDDGSSSHAEDDNEEEEVALVAHLPTQLAIVSPMAYETEDQQNAFFAHYVQSTNSNSALLSYIAMEMYKRILPDDVTKDGVEFHYLFTGKEAVDHIIDISQGADRKRALLIGHALESLDVYHGIDGERRFVDASSELYRFTALTIQRAKDGDTKLTTGVFTPQTPCYSPTCSTDRPCYSNSCPKVKKRIKRTKSQYVRPEKRSSRALWIQSVPKLVIATTPPEERKRQECIYELIYTEEDFAKDLDYLHNSWVKPLLTNDIVSGSEKRELLVQQIFWNVEEIEKISKALSGALVQRRKEQDVVDTIGDVMMAFICQFEPYVAYGSHQVIGKYYFELEKRRNPKFAQFVKETERRPESKRLELNGYLTKPTTRLGRYNLLLREILKRTPQGNPDRTTIPEAMEAIAKLLERVNEETGLVERSFTLQQIDERLTFKSTSITVNLQLLDTERELLMQGKMKRKGHSSSEEMQVLLFDHYLVLSKIKHHNHTEHYKVSRKPIPLDVLSLSVVDTSTHGRSRPSTPSSATTPPTQSSNSSITSPRPSTSTSTETSSSLIPSLSSSTSTNGLAGVTFYHHGRNGSPPITLYTNSMATRDLWVEKILAQKEKHALATELLAPLTKQTSNSSTGSAATPTLVINTT